MAIWISQSKFSNIKDETPWIIEAFKHLYLLFNIKFWIKTLYLNWINALYSIRKTKFLGLRKMQFWFFVEIRFNKFKLYLVLNRQI